MVSLQCVPVFLFYHLIQYFRFAIPFTFATTLGLAAVALRGDPSMKPLSPADVSAGLPAAAAASALLGKSGAAALLILLFLAVTSATSAELIAVSSILTYDVYKRYINPRATEEQILRMGHAMVAFFALCMGLAGVIFFYIGVSMGWLYTFMGVILGSAVVPIALCITWSKANKWGCISGAIAGFFAGVIAWLVTTSTLNSGAVNVIVRIDRYLVPYIYLTLNPTRRLVVAIMRCLPAISLQLVLGVSLRPPRLIS